MNHEVNGEAVEESPDNILRNRPDFFRNFSIVIVTEMGEKSLKALSKLLWDTNIPLVIVRSYGFIGYIRLQAKEHPVVESHPDNAIHDLRLDKPFPAMVEFMNSQDLSVMTKQQHMHTPYLVILYKFLRVWRDAHGGEMPKNYKEKKEFKELVGEGIATRPPNANSFHNVFLSHFRCSEEC